MDKRDLLKLAADPKYIKGIYNYCDRWCERCPFTSRCLNCELVERQFGDLEEKDRLNEAFWHRFSDILHDTLELVREKARERGIDLDAIEADEGVRDEQDEYKRKAAVHLIVHASQRYADRVSDWIESNAGLFVEKASELDRIRIATPGSNPASEAVRINDAAEVIQWYLHQIGVKLRRAIESARSEEEDGGDGYPKDSDGSAKVALIGIDRSIEAWKMLHSSFSEQKQMISNFIESLEHVRRSVESQFSQARVFHRPGFDEAPP
jgi:hypothetical protein